MFDGTRCPWVPFFLRFSLRKNSYMNETVITLFGSIDRYWYNKNYLKYFLDKAKGQPVRLKVSSPGGDVAEAVAMSSLMSEHGNVTVEFISFNASAATILAFGAKSIEMHEDGMWLAHKCSLGIDIWGHLNADQIEDVIKELQNKKKSAEAIDLMAEYAAKGSVMAVSDAGCAAALCKAALQAASLNVFINTKLMADRERAAALDAKTDKLLDEFVSRADAVFASVTNKLRNK